MAEEEPPQFRDYVEEDHAASVVIQRASRCKQARVKLRALQAEEAKRPKNVRRSSVLAGTVLKVCINICMLKILRNAYLFNVFAEFKHKSSGTRHHVLFALTFVM
jgi:hypothetical protein